MNRERVYKIALLLLVLLNLLQVGARLIHDRPPRNMHRKVVVKHLELDATQEKQFFREITKHRKSIQQLHRKQQVLTQSYFTNPSEERMQEILALEKEKFQVTEAHFTSLKSFLREEQYADFEAFKQKAIQHILRSEPKPQPGKEAGKPSK